MNGIRKEIKDIFGKKVSFIKGADDKLVGYAEMFGETCIPLYEGINYTLCSKEEVIDNIHRLNPRARSADGFDNCIIGYIKIDEQTLILYDREGIIEQLKKEYMEDKTGLFDGEEDCETSAIEMFEYNIIGSYMEGIPAFATIYKKQVRI